MAQTKQLLEKYREECNLLSYDDYFKKLAVSNRYDTKEVIFFKRLLQVELNEDVRNKLTNDLFLRIVGVEEETFSRELYMSKEQLSCMISCGMHIGSHGHDHYWLGSLTKEKQRTEIIRSLDFINEIGGNVVDWTICYPYGNYNEDTIDLLKEYKCSLGFSTILGIANTKGKGDVRYKMPRLDTNDLPKDRRALTNEWFVKSK
ncbi:Polysaccharide deacetylase [compost metagenome]